VGIIPHTLPFTTSNYAIKTFRHALALDEHRAKFMPNCWNKPTPAEEELGDQPLLVLAKKKQKGDWHREAADAKQTDVEEVWFAGCHCGTSKYTYPGR
jgi:uncharacterized protein (DUF2235 family)